MIQEHEAERRQRMTHPSPVPPPSPLAAPDTGRDTGPDIGPDTGADTGPDTGRGTGPAPAEATGRLLELAATSVDASWAVLWVDGAVQAMAAPQPGIPPLPAACVTIAERMLRDRPLPLLMPDCRVDCATDQAWPPVSFRFCAALPVREEDGRICGLLAVLDHVPRPSGLGPAELRRIQALADLIGGELGLRRELAEARQVAEALDLRMERLRQDQDGMLRSIDHRIRNGLQMVNDILALQAMALGDTAAAARLEAAAGRVQAVAEVHAHLQRSPATGHVLLRDYIALLLRRLRPCWPDPSRGLSLQPGPEVVVSALDAPRIGIIAWELLVNALRHGRGDISITLCPRPEVSQLRLVVQDAGPGPDAATLVAAGRRGYQKSGLGLIRLIAGGNAAVLEPGPQARIGITVSLRRPAG